MLSGMLLTHTMTTTTTSTTNVVVVVDVIFEVDDGTVRAHRALLTTRSDVMASMFTNDFVEKSAKLV